MDLDLWLTRSFLWPFAMLLGLKFWARPRAGWVTFGLLVWWLGLVADVAVPALGLFHPVGPSYPAAALVVVAVLTLYLSVRLARRAGPLPPYSWEPTSQDLSNLLLVGGGAAGFLLCPPVSVCTPAYLQPGVASACLGMLAGSLLVSEPRRTVWRSLGVLAVPRAWMAWTISLLCLELWLGGGTHYWLLLPILLRVRPLALNLSPILTQCRATSSLRSPLPTVNRCLELIPLELQRSWFRPDATRLHLREPLLETQNAPGYFAALAEFISQRYQLCACTQQQLADFCVRFPIVPPRRCLPFR